MVYGMWTSGPGSVGLRVCGLPFCGIAVLLFAGMAFCGVAGLLL